PNERLNPPVELVIADNPGVKTEMIEHVDHQASPGSQANVGALVDISDVNQNRVRIFPPPPPQLGYAPRQSTQIGSSIITFGRQNVSMQIGGMQNRNRDDVRRERCRLSEIRYGADQTGTAGDL